MHNHPPRCCCLRIALHAHRNDPPCPSCPDHGELATLRRATTEKAAGYITEVLGLTPTMYQIDEFASWLRARERDEECNGE